MTKAEVKSWLEILIQDYIYEDVEDELIEMRDIIYNALDTQALEQTDVLDKIKAEIKEWYWQADKQALTKDPCVVDAMVDLFIRTIDKYKAESEK